MRAGKNLDQDPILVGEMLKAEDEIFEVFRVVGIGKGVKGIE